MRAMVLDGQYAHSIEIATELSRELGAEILAVAPSTRSHLHRSRSVAQGLIAPLATSPSFADRILELADEYRPDVVVPVGYYSYRAMIDRRNELPDGVHLLAPSAAAFNVAESKEATYALAQRIGVDVPRDFTAKSSEGQLRDEDFPLFVKARLERGGPSTALVRDASQLAALDLDSLGGDVLIQEFIDAEPYTYAHSGCYINGQEQISHQHQELRSVPRLGGSGTRLKTYFSEEMATAARSILRELAWTGVAQVEFKRRADGSYVLMEINPKFWASYSLASRSGARIASAAAAHAMGRPSLAPNLGKIKHMEMVFPVREALHVMSNVRTESVLNSAAAMIWPPAVWDVRLGDLWAYVPLRSGTRGDV